MIHKPFKFVKHGIWDAVMFSQLLQMFFDCLTDVLDITKVLHMVEKILEAVKTKIKY